MAEFNALHNPETRREQRLSIGSLSAFVFFTTLILFGLGSLNTATACAFHEPGDSFGFHPMATHRNFAPEVLDPSLRLSSPKTKGIALVAKPQYTVPIGKETMVPYTVIIPKGFEQSKVHWETNDDVTLTNTDITSLGSGSSEELSFTIAPEKSGLYVLRGRLTAQLNGNLSSKSSFILIKAIANQNNLPTNELSQ